MIGKHVLVYGKSGWQGESRRGVISQWSEEQVIVELIDSCGGCMVYQPRDSALLYIQFAEEIEQRWKELQRAEPIARLLSEYVSEPDAGIEMFTSDGDWHGWLACIHCGVTWSARYFRPSIGETSDGRPVFCDYRYIYIHDPSCWIARSRVALGLEAVL